jgi:AbrB family looped-hinge helix DNA binding protein
MSLTSPLASKFAKIANPLKKLTQNYRAMSLPLEQYTVNLAETGELVIPETVRKQLNLQPGDSLTLTLENDGSLRLFSLRKSVQKIQGIFKDIAPGISLADELIQERREEVHREGEA